MDTKTHLPLFPISRRQFVRHLALWGGAALMPDRSAQGAPTSLWAEAGPAGKYNHDTVTQITVHDDIVVYIRRDAVGAFSAFSARCTHLGCNIDWDSHRRQYVCPCHGGVYDETGKNLSGPPPQPLRRLPTKVDERGILNVQVIA